MPERRVPKIMTHRNGFRQILIEAQTPRYRPGNLRYLQRMRQPRPIMVTLGRQKHLRLVLKTPERFAVNNAVAVALKHGSHWARRQKAVASFRFRGFGRTPA
jgi:hypothetical protein